MAPPFPLHYRCGFASRLGPFCWVIRAIIARGGASIARLYRKLKLRDNIPKGEGALLGRFGTRAHPDRVSELPFRNQGRDLQNDASRTLPVFVAGATQYRPNYRAERRRGETVQPEQTQPQG